MFIFPLVLPLTPQKCEGPWRKNNNPCRKRLPTKGMLVHVGPLLALFQTVDSAQAMGGPYGVQAVVVRRRDGLREPTSRVKLATKASRERSGRACIASLRRCNVLSPSGKRQGRDAVEDEGAPKTEVTRIVTNPARQMLSVGRRPAKSCGMRT